MCLFLVLFVIFIRNEFDFAEIHMKPSQIFDSLKQSEKIFQYLADEWELLLHDGAQHHTATANNTTAEL